MPENIYERINQTLTWKRIVGFNLMLLLVLVVPLSVRLANQSTELRSGAAGELEPSPIIPPPNYPVNPPTLDRVNSFFGKTGDTVVLLGSNFGDYQWGSKVYVGSIEAPKEAIVRWSQSILEVKIPEGAKTGKVWVTINGRQATWDGNLILYDPARSMRIGIQKVSSTQGIIFLTQGASVVRGIIELGYVSEPVSLTAKAGVTITEQVTGADNLGKKLLINFEVTQPVGSSQTPIIELSYPGIGNIEIVRAELFDASGKILSVFTDPLTGKLVP